MNELRILDTFASHSFLRDLSEQHLMLLASGARPFTVQPGEYLSHQGEPANHFYLIQSGQVSLEMESPAGEAIPLQTAGPGEAVGWSWLVPQHLWEFDCRAIGLVQGIAFDAEWLREKCEEDPTLSQQLLKRLVAVLDRRLVAARRLIAELSEEQPSKAGGVM